MHRVHIKGFSNLVKENDVKHDRSAPFSPQQQMEVGVNILRWRGISLVETPVEPHGTNGHCSLV